MNRCKQVFLILMSLLPAAAMAQDALVAIPLTPVQLDVTLNCPRLFFKSSNFPGTLFVIPRVVAGTGIEDQPIYDVIPSSTPGKYILSIHLYFPSNEESLKSRGASGRKPDVYSCNWDDVKDAANKSLSKAEQINSNPVPLPLTSLDVKVPGINSLFRIGDGAEPGKSVDEVQYYGQYVTVSIEISESELNQFQQGIISDQGIDAMVFPHFQAKLADGSVNATVDTSSLQASLQGLAQGQATIASAQFNAFLQTNRGLIQVNIVSDAGKSGAMADTNKQVIDQVLSSIKTSVNAAQSADPNSACKPPADSSKIAVCAAINAMSSVSSTSISIQQIGTPESTTALIPNVNFKVRTLIDPNNRPILVQAGYKSPSVGFYLHAGETTVITADAQRLDEIDYVGQKKLLSASEITDLHLERFFPKISDPAFAIKDLDPKPNNQRIGEGNFSSNFKWTAPKTWASWYQNPINSHYRWERTLWNAERINKSSQRLARTRQTIDDLPVNFSFSEIGDTYVMRFADLLNYPETEYWSARLDDRNGIVITAKKDLGILKFHENMQDPGDLKQSKQVKDRVVEQRLYENYSNYEKPGITGSKDLETDDAAISLQRTYIFYAATPKVIKLSPPPALAIPPPTPSVSGNHVAEGTHVPDKNKARSKPLLAPAPPPPQPASSERIPIAGAPSFGPPSGLPPAVPQVKSDPRPSIERP